MQPLTFNDPSSLGVLVSRTALASIAEEAVRSLGGNETGGVLLGHDLGQLVVHHAGAPGPKADHHPDRFLRDLQYAQELARAAWEEDRSQWIGEWHTHPNGVPEPSPTDLRSYLRHLHDPELMLKRFLSVIVSVEEDNIRAVAWVIYPSAAYLVPLLVEEEE